MNIYIHWLLVLSAVVGIVGFWAYTLEVMRDKISRFTRWSDFDSYQSFVAWMMIGGIITFFITLVVGAILK